MRRKQNQNTQPFLENKIFQNWDVVAKGWYFALPSHQLRPGQARSLDLCGQRIVLWRGESGAVYATDAFCPHMGTDLGIGQVEGDLLRCFFHHWRYDGEGRCVGIPVTDKIPEGARLASYATDEAYGWIWVYPDAVAPSPVPRHPELEEQEVVAVHGISYLRQCHHHVTMINGIDPQHLRTVHGIDMDMQLSTQEQSSRGIVDFHLQGLLPSETILERVVRGLLGPRYGYQMRYSYGTMGLLTVLKGTHWFGSDRPIPELYMIFAYRPEGPGVTRVQPIYVTPRSRGWWIRRVLLWGMKLGFYLLRDEDGMVYENMRFRPANLLPMDSPVARYIGYVNRLEPSPWSRKLEV